MQINHHASDALLLTYAAGHLSPAPALVVASHLALSSDSAERLRTFEQLGGALIEEQELADLEPDLFERMLARLDETPVSEPAEADVAAHPNHDALDLGFELPAPLAARRIGKWRSIGPGIRFANVDVSEDTKVKLVLLRVAPNHALPHHGHSGNEVTLVLNGIFSDESGTYGPGDICEEDEDSDHQPMVGPDGECVCVIAIQGRLRPTNWLARLTLPFFGF